MAHRPGRSRGWIWFFLVLVGIVGIWTGGSWLFQRYYWGAAVTTDTLAEARARWRAHGPDNYDLELVKQGTVPERMTVHVRAQRVVYAEPDQRPLAEKARDYGVPALFARIEKELNQDSESSQPRARACARFDPQDGHPVRYIRQGPRGGESVQILVVHFQPLPDLSQR